MSEVFYYNTNFDGVGDQSKAWWIEFIKKQILAVMNDTDAENQFRCCLENGIVLNRNAQIASEIILDDETTTVLKLLRKSKPGNPPCSREIMKAACVSWDELNIILNLLCGLGYVRTVGN
jgi:hypothetical protein